MPISLVEIPRARSAAINFVTPLRIARTLAGPYFDRSALKLVRMTLSTFKRRSPPRTDQRARERTSVARSDPSSGRMPRRVGLAAETGYRSIGRRGRMRTLGSVPAMVPSLGVAGQRLPVAHYPYDRQTVVDNIKSE